MLAIDNLTKRYDGPELVLKGINLEIEPGEFVAILGTSGAGKSTLIRCINRLIEPTSGRIFWNDKEINELDKEGLRKYRRNVGMIFQEYNLIERLSVMTNVLTGRFGYLDNLRLIFQRFSKKDKALAANALTRVGLTDYQDNKVRDLSGGQRQRIGIARALTQSPQLILGDEPVSSLDPVTSDKIMGLLKEINLKDKITMLITMHNVEIAKEYADRVIGIANGQVVCDTGPENLTDEILKRIYLG